MTDEKKRNPGKYSEEYSKIVHGKKVRIKETTVVGRKHEILSFTREFDPAVPFVSKK
jgi:hypothetical protein